MDEQNCISDADMIHRDFDTLLEEFADTFKLPFEYKPTVIADQDEWNERFHQIGSIVKAYEAEAQEQKPCNKRLTSLFKALFMDGTIYSYIQKTNRDDSFDVFAKAVVAGFNLDLVLVMGPTPNEKWEDLSWLTPKKLISTVKKKPPKSAEVNPTVVKKTLNFADPIGNPTPDLVEDTLQAFVTSVSTGPGSSLPMSTHPGMSTQNSTTLPQLSNPPRPTSLAPCPFQEIFPLKKFLPTYVVPEEGTPLVLKDGSLSTKASLSKITSPSLWVTAALGLSRHLQALHNEGKEPSFNHSEFTCYVDYISALFSAHSFQSVMNYETAFRRWRRTHGHQWTAENHLLRALILK